MVPRRGVLRGTAMPSALGVGRPDTRPRLRVPGRPYSLPQRSGRSVPGCGSGCSCCSLAACARRLPRQARAGFRSVTGRTALPTGCGTGPCPTPRTACGRSRAGRARLGARRRHLRRRHGPPNQRGPVPAAGGSRSANGPGRVLAYVGDARSASEAAGNWQPGETVEKFHTRPTWHRDASSSPRSTTRGSTIAIRPAAASTGTPTTRRAGASRTSARGSRAASAPSTGGWSASSPTGTGRDLRGDAPDRRALCPRRRRGPHATARPARLRPPARLRGPGLVAGPRRPGLLHRRQQRQRPVPRRALRPADLQPRPLLRPGQRRTRREAGLAAARPAGGRHRAVLRGSRGLLPGRQCRPPLSLRGRWRRRRRAALALPRWHRPGNDGTVLAWSG